MDKRTLRVLFLCESDIRDQATRNRPYAFSKELSKYGIECSVLYGKRSTLVHRRGGRWWTPSLRNYMLAMKAINRFDMLYICRTANPIVRFIQKMWKKRGKYTVYDLDDALFLRNFAGFPLLSPVYMSINEIIKCADAVVAGNHYIYKYCKQSNPYTYLIPSPVDLELFNVPRVKTQKTQIIIGWEGHGPVHSENLEILVRPLERLAKLYKFEFKMVSYLGSQFIKQLFSGLEKLIEVDYGFDYWVDLGLIPRLISDFDVGLMPLTKSEWSKGKCGQKIIEYMSLGIPVVASDVGENRYIIDNGVDGFLVTNDPDDWFEKLSILLNNPDLRGNMGSKGLEKARKRYSLNVCGNQLVNILKEIVE